MCVIQQAYGDPGTHAQLRQQDSEIKGSSGHMTAKERKYVAVTSVGLPGVVLWHVACPKLCCALPEASHLTRLWPGIINRHLALLSQESDSRPSAFSEVLAIGCSSCIGSSVRLAIPCTLTHLPSLFSQSSRASSQRFFSCPSVPCRDSVLVVLSVSGAGTVTLWHGRLQIRQELMRWLDFSRDLVSLWPKTRQR